jgi:ligand-binding sensor domain-containing protein
MQVADCATHNYNAGQFITDAGYKTISTVQDCLRGMLFDMLQDKEGFIYAAAKNGLNRYDGYNFKAFCNNLNNPHTLNSNSIVRLFEGSRGWILAGTEDAGSNVYNKQMENSIALYSKQAIPAASHAMLSSQLKSYPMAGSC